MRIDQTQPNFSRACSNSRSAREAAAAEGSSAGFSATNGITVSFCGICAAAPPQIIGFHGSLSVRGPYDARSALAQTSCDLIGAFDDEMQFVAHQNGLLDQFFEIVAAIARRLPQSL